MELDDLSPATRDAIESIVLRLVNRAMLNASEALLRAGLDVTLGVERFDEKFDIVIRSKLPADQRKLAEEITSAALESVILQAATDGKLHLH